MPQRKKKGTPALKYLWIPLGVAVVASLILIQASQEGSWLAAQARRFGIQPRGSAVTGTMCAAEKGFRDMLSTCSVCRESPGPRPPGSPSSSPRPSSSARPSGTPLAQLQTNRSLATFLGARDWLGNPTTAEECYA